MKIYFFIFNKKIKNYVELIYSITHESIFYLKFNAILLCINFLLITKNVIKYLIQYIFLFFLINIFFIELYYF